MNIQTMISTKQYDNYTILNICNSNPDDIVNNEQNANIYSNAINI